MHGREFMRDCGVKIADGNNVVRYTEMVSDINKEPDYDAALAAPKEI